jgi:hypothetical protein
MEASDIISAVETSTPDPVPVEGQEDDRPLSENNTSSDSGDDVPEQQYRGWEWQWDKRYDRSPAPSPLPDAPAQLVEAPPRRPQRQRQAPKRFDPRV